MVDTSTNQVPAAPALADTAAPASVEPTNSEMSNVPAQAGTTEDKLYAGKYRDVEELENAYRELQRHSTQVEMERAELRRNQVPTAPDQNQALLGDQEALSLLNRLIDDRVRPIKEKAELNDMFTKYKDFGDYAPKVADELRKAPNLSWEQAYKITKFDDRAREAREEGKKEAYAKIDEKTRAAVVPPSTKQPSRPIGEIIADRSVPLKEIEKMLPRS